MPQSLDDKASTEARKEAVQYAEMKYAENRTALKTVEEKATEFFKLQGGIGLVSTLLAKRQDPSGLGTAAFVMAVLLLIASVASCLCALWVRNSVGMPPIDRTVKDLTTFGPDTMQRYSPYQIHARSVGLSIITERKGRALNWSYGLFLASLVLFAVLLWN